MENCPIKVRKVIDPEKLDVFLGFGEEEDFINAGKGNSQELTFENIINENSDVFKTLKNHIESFKETCFPLVCSITSLNTNFDQRLQNIKTFNTDSQQLKLKCLAYLSAADEPDTQE